jgi:hypothetical protein
MRNLEALPSADELARLEEQIKESWLMLQWTVFIQPHWRFILPWDLGSKSYVKKRFKGDCWE